MMQKNIMKVDCSEDEFSVQSHDQRELIRITKEHIKNMHHEKISDEEIKLMIQTV
jgi:predicted small metal-binding protein